MRFEELRLAEPIVRAVAAEGYTTPTPIQTKAIPGVLAGNDLLGCARTGTGKTAAFALPILDRLAKAAAPNQDRSAGRNGSRGRKVRGEPGRKPRALVICPTRELATQIFESFKAYGRNLSLRHCVVFGGVNQAGQVRELRAGIDVLVATPGRLLDLMGQGFIDLGAIEVLVLDEADRMLDMGFIHDIRRVVERLPSRRQTLLFSATMPPEIRRLANSILRDPISVEAAPVSSTVEAIAQTIYMISRTEKPILLESLLRHDATERTLVFTRTKYGADKLVKVLRRRGIESAAIHGNKSQNARTRALAEFKSGQTSVLIATDIASRGIDVDEITHVINYDMPHDAETYVHRIGRTARAGASGTAVSFCGRDDIAALRSIEKLIRMKLDVIDNDNELGRESDMPKQRQSSPNNTGPATSGRSRSGRARRPAQPGRKRRRGSNARAHA